MDVLNSILETYRAAVPVANETTSKSFIVSVVKYAFPILLYERLPYKYYTWPFAYFILTYMSIIPTIDSAILNIVASKNSFLLKGCGCSEKQIMRGNISSIFYYIGHRIFICLLYYIPFVGFYIYWILYLILYGYGILEYFLSKMCTAHKYKFFSETIPFCFGIGLCVHGMTRIICYILNIENPFLYTAILQVINTQIIMNARYCPKHIMPLPNPFHLSRAATSYVIKIGSEKLIKGLEDDVFVEYGYINILGSGFEDLKSFLHRDICKYFLFEYEIKFKKSLKTLLEMSEKTNVIWVIEIMAGVMPESVISEKVKIVLKILQKKGMVEKLRNLQSILNEIWYENNITIFSDAEMVKSPSFDILREMSRSPSIEFSEDEDFIMLKFPKEI